MRIKEAAALTGLAERTIRFYEEEGLFQPRKEYLNGRYYRDYSDNDIRDLKMLATLRQAGFTMDEIRRMQNEADCIGDTVSLLSQRLTVQKEAAETLSAALDSLPSQALLSIYDLADAFSRSIERLRLPKPDVHLNFGRFDDVDDAQIAAAYEDHRKRRDSRLPSWQVVTVLLIVLLFCGLAAASLYFSSAATRAGSIAFPTETTDGWTYYTESNDAASTFDLLRRNDATGEVQLLFTENYVGVVPEHYFQFYVGKWKVYYTCDDQLFSVNADGTGQAHMTNHCPGKFQMQEYGGSLYFLEYNDGLGRLRFLELYVIPITGGQSRKLLSRVKIDSDLLGSNDDYHGFVIKNDTLFINTINKGYYAIDLADLRKDNIGSGDKNIFDVIDTCFEEAVP